MLSDRQIQAAIRTCSRETVLNDGAGGKGTGTLVLVIRRTARGTTAQWAGQWWADGRRRRKTIGRYPDMPLSAARQACAEQVRAVLAEGKNPRARVTMADKPTVQRLFDAYCDRMEADGKSSAKEVRRCLGFAAQHLGPNRLACDIDPADLSDYLGRLYTRGAPVTADRVRSYLSAAFNHGIKATYDYRADMRQDWGIKANPVAAIRRHADASKPRDRVLSPEELRQLWQAVDGPGFAFETRAAVRLMICCGQRVRETLRMDASEVDLERRLWTMPAHKTKVGRFAHTVPLSELAVATIKELLTVRRTGLLMPITDHAITRAINRWQVATGIPRYQVRDLRRTWKSLAAAAGVDRFTRDLIQQHAMGDTGSKHYDRADYLPQMQDAMDKWSIWLSKCLQSENG